MTSSCIFDFSQYDVLLCEVFFLVRIGRTNFTFTLEIKDNKKMKPIQLSSPLNAQQNTLNSPYSFTSAL